MINHVRQHRKMQRTSRKVLNCSSELNEYKSLKCDHWTPSRANLKRHVCSMNPTGEYKMKTYKCKNCDFHTSSCLMLSKHIYRDCKNVINNWNQPVSESCEKNDESVEIIDNIKKENVEKVDKNETVEIEWYCGYCFFKTELKRDLRKHIQQEHSSTEKSNILNKSNNDTHTTKEIKWFKCDNCSYKSKQKHQLKRHILAKHTAAEKINWFKCEHCSFQSKQKGHLKQHIIYKHTAPEKIKWFKCDDCAYQCKVKSSLTKHILHKHDPLAMM